MGKYLTKTGLTKYTAKLKEYISKAKVASAAAADNAIKVNNHTVNIDVPSTAKFTDTTYEEATTSKAGLLSTEDKMYLQDIKKGLNVTNEEGDITTTLNSTMGIDLKVKNTSVISISDSDAVDINADNNDCTISAGSTLTLNAGDSFVLDSKDTIESYAAGDITIKTTGTDDNDITFGNDTIQTTLGKSDISTIGDGSLTGAIKAAYEKPTGRVTAGAIKDSIVGQYATAEGIYTTASGYASHAEGEYVTASGSISHASGCGTFATRRGSYSEGLGGKATGVGAHVEGTYAVGYMGQGSDYYTEVDITIKEIPASQLNTVKTTTGLTDVKYYMYYTNNSSALSYLPDAIQAGIDNGEDVVHLFDNPLTVDEFYSFTSSQVKQVTISSVINKPAMYFGNPNFTDESIIKSLLNKNLEKIWIAVSFNKNYTLSTASGAASHCEGGGNTASGHYSHAEGVYTEASGIRSHAQGCSTVASGITAFASGCSTIASGQSSFAGGIESKASGASSFAIGDSSTASGYASFSEGSFTIAEGYYSHASGDSTKASNWCSYAMGHFNAAMTTGGTSSNKVGTALAIGNGASESARSNAFSVQFSGITKAANTITASTTADYAEFFEWLDENPNAEDRVGYFVTLDGDKIKIAEADDDYILGVISDAPFVLGNGDCDVWNGMYLRDEFRRLKEEPAPKIIQVKNKETKKYENQVVEGEYEGTRFVLNPNYDSSQEYKSRFDRPEWAAVGMLGVLPVRHDGTARVNGYVTVGANGIATACERTAANAYRVIKENSDSVVEIIFR